MCHSKIATCFIFHKWVMSRREAKLSNIIIMCNNKYPYNCFAMTIYQSLLMALVSLPPKLGPEEVSLCTETEVTSSRF